MTSVSESYNALVAEGEITEDPIQISLVKLYDELLINISEKQLTQKGSALGWLFGKRKENKNKLKGLYVFGEVGRGKTMLMDLFFQQVPNGIKRRAHFNDFMADVHDRINAHRQALARGETKQNDPIPVVAEALAKEAWVLCFDEFTVTDIADAMILGRLFTALFAQGVVLIATSNVLPDNLYYNGLNRDSFLPFIKILKDHINVFNLDAPIDYRLEKADKLPVYVTPLGQQAHEKMTASWLVATGGEEGKPVELNLRGRMIEVPYATDDCAHFDFIDLCIKPLGAADYLEIVKHYRTIFIENVPILDDEHRNETKRFILLIDTLYDHHTRLYMSAAEIPAKLYQGKARTTETFEFERTASRLFEMQSAEYIEAWAAGDPRKA